jgi:uncharacterized protein YdhG (YjbR/CyaY superfamily)
MSTTKPATVDQYIDAASPEAQRALREMRAVLKKVAPKAAEKLKWGQPVLEEKRILFAYSAHKSHLNFMPTRRTLDSFREELRDYATGKDTVQFPYHKPLPKPLIRKLAHHRAKDVRENDARWM